MNEASDSGDVGANVQTGSVQSTPVRPAEQSASFDTRPRQALHALATHSGPVIVDLDETLYLRNSTEDFIDCARPSLLAVLLLKIIDVLRPWRLTGGTATRDVWRVRTISLLLPWTWIAWRRRASTLASDHTNRPLRDALDPVGERLIIATLGFKPIVTPLLRAMGLGSSQLIATDGRWLDGRRAGKLQLVEQAIGPIDVSQALVLTDSLDDLPLLKRCAVPLRTIWPDAEFVSALSRVYLPGLYLARVKRPGENYARTILRQDFVCWLLCGVALTAWAPLRIVGLLCLLASFWAIYELGYVDNDQVAAEFEAAPRLSDEFFTVKVATPRVTPWIWAGLAGAGGVVAIRYPQSASAMDFAKWGIVLVSTFSCFALYNRVDKATRVWLYWLLQLARLAAPLALLPALPAVTAGLGADLLSRWLPYQQYRSEGRWPKDDFTATRLLMFVMLGIVLAITSGTSAIVNWTGLGFFLWMIYPARHSLKSMATSVSRIKRERTTSEAAIAHGNQPQQTNASLPANA